jgi:hypothetical protein
MTVKQAKAVIEANGQREILPGSKEMSALLVLATKVGRNKS